VIESNQIGLDSSPGFPELRHINHKVFLDGQIGQGFDKHILWQVSQMYPTGQFKIAVYDHGA
jgi:hypothetical protein